MSDFLISKEDLIKKGSSGSGDPRIFAKKIFVGALAAGAAYMFGVFVLPILVTIAWNLTSLIIAGTITAILLMIVTNKKFWMRVGYFVDLLMKIMLFWLIEFDEFILQEKQIESAEKDLEKMDVEREKIEGKYVELNSKVLEKKENYLIAEKSLQIATKEGDKEAAEDCVAEMSRSDNFVKTMEPMVNDMQLIINFAKDMKKIIARKIKNAKDDLAANKDLFYSAQAGANALGSAKKAFMGNTDLNSDAEVAKQKVKEKIALSIGQMRTSIDVLTTASKEVNLRDAAKLALAKERILQINNISNDGSQVIQLPLQNFNKETTKVSKYRDFI